MTEKLRKCESKYKKIEGKEGQKRKKGKKKTQKNRNKSVIWLGTNIGEA